jgi:hypothetical protein
MTIEELNKLLAAADNEIFVAKRAKLSEEIRELSAKLEKLKLEKLRCYARAAGVHLTKSKARFRIRVGHSNTLKSRDGEYVPYVWKMQSEKRESDSRDVLPEMEITELKFNFDYEAIQTK